MIETPLESSSQKSIAFTLDNTISKNTLITLVKDDEIIVSFESPKGFKTIIVSDSKLDNGTYYLYKDGINKGTLEYGIYKNNDYTLGTKIEINNNDIFLVEKTINYFGNNIR